MQLAQRHDDSCDPSTQEEIHDLHELIHNANITPEEFETIYT